MGYSYEVELKRVLSREGQLLLLQVRDFVLARIEFSGAVLMEAVLNGARGQGDDWLVMACVDHLVALRVVREVSQLEPPAGQGRVFVKSWS